MAWGPILDGTADADRIMQNHETWEDLVDLINTCTDFMDDYGSGSHTVMPLPDRGDPFQKATGVWSGGTVFAEEMDAKIFEVIYQAIWYQSIVNGGTFELGGSDWNTYSLFNTPNASVIKILANARLTAASCEKIDYPESHFDTSEAITYDGGGEVTNGLGWTRINSAGVRVAGGGSPQRGDIMGPWWWNQRWAVMQVLIHYGFALAKNVAPAGLDQQHYHIFEYGSDDDSCTDAQADQASNWTTSWTDDGSTRATGPSDYITVSGEGWRGTGTYYAWQGWRNRMTFPSPALPTGSGYDFKWFFVSALPPDKEFGLTDNSVIKDIDGFIGSDDINKICQINEVTDIPSSPLTSPDIGSGSTSNPAATMSCSDIPAGADELIVHGYRLYTHAVLKKTLSSP